VGAADAVPPVDQTFLAGSDAELSLGEMAANKVTQGDRPSRADADEELPADAKLRRRLVDRAENSLQDPLHKKEDEYDDDLMGLSPKVMHRLLKGAVCLGLVSLLAACFVAVLGNVYTEQ